MQMVTKKQFVWIPPTALAVGWGAGVHSVYAGLNFWGSVVELAFLLFAWAAVVIALAIIDQEAQRPKVQP